MPAGKFLWDSTFETVVRRLVEIDAEIRWEGIVEQLRGQEDEDGSESDDLDPDDLRTAAACFSGGAHMGGDSDCEMDGTADGTAPRMDISTHTAALLGTAEDTKLGVLTLCTCISVWSEPCASISSARNKTRLPAATWLAGWCARPKRVACLCAVDLRSSVLPDRGSKN